MCVVDFFMDFMDILENEFLGIKEYCDVCGYNLTPRAFSMESIWSFNDYLLFILSNKGKSLTLEIENFVENHFDDNDEKLITKEAVSKQRQKINPELFIDMNKNFIKEFLESEEYDLFVDDKIVLLVDGSKSEIPNTPESKKWANIEDDELRNKKALRVLFSTVIDVKYGVVIDSILGKYNSNEREFLKQHIKNIEKFVNLDKIILIMDAGYYSLELKIFLENLGIKYIFRLGSDVYKKEISQMTKIDENLKIRNITSRRKAIKDENILKKAKELPYIEARIIKLPIINQNNKKDQLIILTNVYRKKFNAYEIADLYRQRWEIEVNYDRLKNKMEIENYSGKLEITIKQDFYSSIYIFNLAMILRNNIHKNLKPKNIKKLEKENKIYRTNFNTLIGRIKNKLLDLFTSKKEKIKIILNRIILRGIKDIYLYDFNRPNIKWYNKIFIGKFRYNQRRNI